LPAGRPSEPHDVVEPELARRNATGWLLALVPTPVMEHDEVDQQ
jgi:phage terminase large subunit-like protein